MGSDHGPHHHEPMPAISLLRGACCAFLTAPGRSLKRKFCTGWLAETKRLRPAEAGTSEERQEGIKVKRKVVKRGGQQHTEVLLKPSRSQVHQKSLGRGIWQRPSGSPYRGGSWEPHGRAEAGCSSSTGVINRVAGEMKSQEGSGLAIIRILMRAK